MFRPVTASAPDPSPVHWGPLPDCPPVMTESAIAVSPLRSRLPPPWFALPAVAMLSVIVAWRRTRLVPFVQIPPPHPGVPPGGPVVFTMLREIVVDSTTALPPSM